MARKPSHLGSNRRLPSAGRLSVSLANMGSIGGSIGNDIEATTRQMPPARTADNPGCLQENALPRRSAPPCPHLARSALRAATRWVHCRRKEARRPEHGLWDWRPLNEDLMSVS